MMRKLLVLFLVLAMASVANAAITWQLKAGSNPIASATITLELVSTVAGDSVDSVSIGKFSDGGGAGGAKIGNAVVPVVNINAGYTTQAFLGTNGAGFPGCTAGDLLMVSVSITPGSPVVGAVTHLEYQYTIAATAVNGEVINFGYPGAPPGWNDNATLTGGATVVPAACSVTVVPEPATIAMLGFGGLLLLRKRK